MAKQANALPPIPIQSPVITQGNMIGVQWLALIREMYARIGGSVSTSNSSLATQATSLTAQIAALQAQADFGVGRQL